MLLRETERDFVRALKPIFRQLYLIADKPLLLKSPLKASQPTEFTSGGIILGRSIFAPEDLKIYDFY